MSKYQSHVRRPRRATYVPQEPSTTVKALVIFALLIAAGYIDALVLAVVR